MNRVIEGESQEVRHEVVTPDDQAIMTAPRAYLLGYMNAVCLIKKETDNISSAIDSIKSNLTLATIGSTISGIILLVFLVIFVAHGIVAP